MHKLTIPCVSCNATGINVEGLEEVVEGVSVKTWLTGKVSDVVNESTSLKSVTDLLIFKRIRELNKKEMMAIYQYLEQNN